MEVTKKARTRQFSCHVTRRMLGTRLHASPYFLIIGHGSDTVWTRLVPKKKKTKQTNEPSMVTWRTTPAHRRSSSSSSPLVLLASFCSSFLTFRYSFCFLDETQVDFIEAEIIQTTLNIQLNMLIYNYMREHLRGRAQNKRTSQHVW